VFSVVIPLYNKEKHIQRAVNSVLAQSDQDYEIIIVDDGSTDGSYEAISAIKDSRLHIIRQENRGVSAARNRGVLESSYAWVAFLDADDEWMPDFLENLKGLNKNYPNCGVLATAYVRYKPAGFDHQELEKIDYPDGWSGIMEHFFTHLRVMVPFCSSSFAAKKEILQSVGGFPLGVKVGEDVNLWIRLYLITEIAYLKRIGAIYYLDSGEHVSRPIHELFSDPQKDYSHGEFLRKILDEGRFEKKEKVEIIELMAKHDIPIIRKLIHENNRLEALSRIWSIKSTRIYRRKWISLLAECLLPKFLS